MNELSKEKTMTIKEVAELLKVSRDTIRNKVKQYFPELLVNGKTTRLNEVQVTKIKIELEKNPNLPTNEIIGMTDLEALLLQKKLDKWKDDKIKQLEAEKAVMKPKAIYYDKLVDNSHLTNLRDTASQLGISQKTFISYLLKNNFIYRTESGKLKPYNSVNNMSYFDLKDFTKNGYQSQQTYITVEGKQHFLKLFNKG
jgi:excisionase family DNA binding protein